MHCLDKDLTAHALFRSYVILILVHMSSGSKIQNQKKSTEPETGQAVLDTSDQLKKMENDLQEMRSNITSAPRTVQPSVDLGQIWEKFWSLKSWLCSNVFGWAVWTKDGTCPKFALSFWDEHHGIMDTVCPYAYEAVFNLRYDIFVFVKDSPWKYFLSWESISFFLYFQHNLNSEINDTLCFH